MTHLLAEYIPTDFNKENKDKFYPYSGNVDALYKAKRIVLWQWPGSDREKRVLDDNSFIINEIHVVNAYKDYAGREWGYINIDYTYSTSNYTNSNESWIYLAEPASNSIPPFYPAPAPVKWSPDENLKWEHEDNVISEPYEQNSLSNITRVKTYNKNFMDVSDNSWYKNAVETAYEYGIVEGKGGDWFDPNGELTVLEALIIASRIHSCYKYGKEEGARWLNVYHDAFDGYGHAGFRYQYSDVRYCESEGLIRAGEFDESINEYNPPTPITRAQMVHAWVRILQPEDMAKQNTVINLPDVTDDTLYYEDIILFYEAGIVGGVDTQGTFNPDSSITRAEAATIFMNLIETGKRHSGRTYEK